MDSYDVVVIGAGPGGYVCAIRAAQLGLRTAIVDKKWLGGVCLNVGCIPTKALLKNAEVAHLLRERGQEFGFSFKELQLDYSAAVKRSRKVSERLTRGVEFLMKKNRIDAFIGTAKLDGPGAVLVTSEDGQSQQLVGKHIVIATGARASKIPGVEVDGEEILTYESAVLQECLPDSAIIIGGGALGTEFATIWNAYGAEVTLVEMLPRLLPIEDEDISAELTKAYKKRHIGVLSGHQVEKVTKGGKGVIVEVSTGDEQKTLEAEQVLIAIGFKANTENIGLEDAGVKLTEKCFIQVDSRMATNVSGIWAIGDVTGQLLLAHVASAQGIVCAESFAGVDTVELDYRMMPRVIYSYPQVASFGLTQKDAEKRGYDLDVGVFPFLANGKSLGLGEQGGFVKIIVDREYGDILGAHMIGPDVSELLPELTLAHQAELSVADIARNVHAHPTLSEVVLEAAHAAGGHAIHS
jgi:dihydrolipoamide dehydrogenase